MADASQSLDSRSQHAANPYTTQIVQGVTDHADRIDETVSTYSRGWTMDRMPAVDRAILRVATWELLWSDTPDAVVISEAVGLADDLSTDESGKFINGVLSRIGEIKDRLALE